MERRRQLGREVFARGEPEPAADAQPAADLTALLRACLIVLELPAAGAGAPTRGASGWSGFVLNMELCRHG
jgi:hypothetical protein